MIANEIGNIFLQSRAAYSQKNNVIEQGAYSRKAKSVIIKTLQYRWRVKQGASSSTACKCNILSVPCLLPFCCYVPQFRGAKNSTNKKKSSIGCVKIFEHE